MGLSDYIDNLDTKNEFQFFNFQDLSNMNKVFDYYKKYAEKILNFNNSEGNIYNKKVTKFLNGIMLGIFQLMQVPGRNSIRSSSN